ncbi:hypothetical protein ALNOE001_06090 [Candidatus Methanobinarius endosymbioticus]|uniref:Big-1 domain-containing protein n=1 Tax=Candidatus Methanobinarius endosymbioticus TaxID=2006182 RepID=A0A366MCG4_9EURY|nr:hypothetical protein ALNOE001_06090 [Candidatus Methanobinarius endosymbioticus]
MVGKLVDSSGKPLANKKITFKVGSKTHTPTTDNNGKAVIRDKNTNKSLILTSCAGDSNYNPYSAGLNNKKILKLLSIKTGKI